eukprot:182616-Lingulodinium_polyedra.AAC.2
MQQAYGPVCAWSLRAQRAPAVAQPMTSTTWGGGPAHRQSSSRRRHCTGKRARAASVAGRAEVAASPAACPAACPAARGEKCTRSVRSGPGVRLARSSTKVGLPTASTTGS